MCERLKIQNLLLFAVKIKLNITLLFGWKIGFSCCVSTLKRAIFLALENTQTHTHTHMYNLMYVYSEMFDFFFKHCLKQSVDIKN